MNRYRLSEVRCLIADATELSAQTTRTILHNLGMRAFTTVRNLDEMREALEREPFDLLVVNSHLGDDETADLINAVRHGDIGHDPFVAVTALSWEPSIDVVSNLINAGTDVLLTLPISPAKMIQALESLIDARKPFVVTSNYIGPDRRHSVRAVGAAIPMHVVPNTLRQKATGKIDVADPDLVRQNIFDQRVVSYVSRITFTVGKITGLSSSKGEGTFSGWLHDLQSTAHNLHHRIADTRFSVHAPLCGTLIDLTEAMAKQDMPRVDDLEVLQQIALALEIATKDDDTKVVEQMLDVTRAFETRSLA